VRTARSSEYLSLSRFVALVGASPLPARRHTGSGHVESYGDDRVCDAPECSTRLSRYNRAAVCWHHGDGGFGPGGRRRN
jgi:hypothetical protein